MKKIRILHVSTAHPPQDPRVAHRVIPSLSADYELVALLPGTVTGQIKGVQSIGLPYRRRVLARVLRSHPPVLWHALRVKPALLHIYDPELLPLARLIQLLLRIPVIYEVHENLYKKIDEKASSHGPLPARLFYRFDAIAKRHFYLIFTEHSYLETYRNLRRPNVVIYNFPLLPFLKPFQKPYTPNPEHPTFFYIGRISLERAFDTIIAGLAILKQRYPTFRMHIFGERTFSDSTLENLPGYVAVRDNLHFYGYKSQQEALPYAARATAGLVLLKPVGDYPESYSTKLFEYMALGLPVVTSDFPLYRDVVERHQCGFCLSPYDPAQLADALAYLIENPDEARQMGQRGQRAVAAEYNWDSEARKLLDFYRLILTDTQP